MGMYSRDELDSIYSDLFSDIEDDRGFCYSTDAEWDRADAYERGSHCPDAAWVVTDRDVWHPNPHYKGPPEPHPESGEWTDEELEAWRRAELARRSGKRPADDDMYDIPF
jgi:hypothetical protein